MGSDSTDGLIVGPAYKTVTVVGRPGRYGWSRRLRKGANCIVARWEGGDQLSTDELLLYLDEFVDTGKIDEAKKVEFFAAIRRLDAGKGKVEDVKRIRTLAKALGMKVVLKASEPSLPYVKPGAYSMTYWQARGLARFIKRTVAGVDVRVYRVERHAELPPTVKEPVSRPGGYVVRVSPMPRSS